MSNFLSTAREAPRAACLLRLVAVAMTCFIAAGGCDKGDTTPPAPKERPIPKGPNFLVITVESLRPDHVGCYSGKLETTPNLDALSQAAITYDNAFSVTSWTLAAHASLFTGLYPTAANIVMPKDALDDKYKTLPEVLHDLGYDTAAVVSGPYLRSKHKLNQGFDRYDDDAISPAGQPAIDDITNPSMESKLLAYVEQRPAAERPFFLFAYFWDPHYDYIPPSPYNKMFVPESAKAIDITHFDSNTSPVTRKSSPQELAYVVGQYDGEIRYTDDTLGRIFARLKALNLWDNTVVIVTSDHGEEFFDHGQKGHKNNLYVESVHVPLIVKPHGAFEPRRDDRLASIIDIYPSVSRMAGYTGRLPPHHGLNLLDTPRHEQLFFELTTSWYMSRVDQTTKKRDSWAEKERWLAVRTPTHKTIGVTTLETRRGRNRNQWELYDAVADPRETKPLNDAAATKMRTAMRDRILQWEKQMEETARLLGKRAEAELTPAELERLKEMGYLN